MNKKIENIYNKVLKEFRENSKHLENAKLPLDCEYFRGQGDIIEKILDAIEVELEDTSIEANEPQHKIIEFYEDILIELDYTYVVLEDDLPFQDKIYWKAKAKTLEMVTDLVKQHFYKKTKQEEKLDSPVDDE